MEKSVSGNNLKPEISNGKTTNFIQSFTSIILTIVVVIQAY